MRAISSKCRQGLGALIRKFAPLWLANLIELWRGTGSLSPRKCVCCGYHGKFGVFGHPPRIDARCPKCGSLERHRLFFLGLSRGKLIPRDEGPDICVLHFAPEPIIEKRLRAEFPKYQSADLYKPADLALNVENIALGSETTNFVIANHVLEHVNDAKAAYEIWRILVSGGVLIASVPLIEGWENTYENPAKAKTASDRAIHFGQHDHVRYYGRDFRDRITRMGFTLKSEITAEGEDVIEFGLLRGEKIFVFTKPH